MPDVGSVSILAALLVQEIRARGRTPGAASPAGRRNDPREAAEAAQAGSILTLQQRITARLRVVEPDDPDRISKGLRIFLEAVLLEELGSDLVDDPAFHTLLTTVHGSMTNSDALAGPIQAAMSDLLRSSRHAAPGGE